MIPSVNFAVDESLRCDINVQTGVAQISNSAEKAA